MYTASKPKPIAKVKSPRRSAANGEATSPGSKGGAKKPASAFFSADRSSPGRYNGPSPGTSPTESTSRKPVPFAASHAEEEHGAREAAAALHTTFSAAATQSQSEGEPSTEPASDPTQLSPAAD